METLMLRAQMGKGPITDMQWCVRVIFVESESQATRVRGESESSKIFFESESESWLGRGESLRVVNLQARANVESHEISRFFYNIFLLWNGAR